MAEDLLKAGSDGKFPSKEELIDAIKKMTNLDEETKKKLLKDVLSSAPESGEGLPPPSADTIAAATSSLPLQMLMLLFLVSLVLMVLAYFGYKLYKSLVERERKKEEKRRQKQQKKKK